MDSEKADNGIPVPFVPQLVAWWWGWNHHIKNLPKGVRDQTYIPGLIKIKIVLQNKPGHVVLMMVFTAMGTSE